MSAGESNNQQAGASIAPGHDGFATQVLAGLTAEGALNLFGKHVDAFTGDPATLTPEEWLDGASDRLAAFKSVVPEYVLVDAIAAKLPRTDRAELVRTRCDTVEKIREHLNRNYPVVLLRAPPRAAQQTPHALRPAGHTCGAGSTHGARSLLPPDQSPSAPASPRCSRSLRTAQSCSPGLQWSVTLRAKRLPCVTPGTH
ncbi:hypothetical protein IWQ56_004494 [Coemansia nantahalensis]|nr:hypothetical protein IWQ56_004494 [Coemansia nantahalensis]